MAIIIDNQEMPKCCDECFALDDYGDYPRCCITNEQRGYTFDTSSMRMDRCPLKKVDWNCWLREQLMDSERR